MLMLSAGLFALAAVSGVALAVLHFTKKPMPMPLALAHGALAAAGLVALIAGMARLESVGMLAAALALLVVAALGGFVLLGLWLTRKPLPCLLIVVHGSIAAAGFVVLLIAMSRIA
jgi:hypothetical protein